MRSNLTELLIAKEKRLKEKYGLEYRSPMTRLCDESLRLVLPSENAILPDLPFVKATG